MRGYIFDSHTKLIEYSGGEVILFDSWSTIISNICLKYYATLPEYEMTMNSTPKMLSVHCAKTLVI